MFIKLLVCSVRQFRGFLRLDGDHSSVVVFVFAEVCSEDTVPAIRQYDVNIAQVVLRLALPWLGFLAPGASNYNGRP